MVRRTSRWVRVKVNRSDLEHGQADVAVRRFSRRGASSRPRDAAGLEEKESPVGRYGIGRESK
jgi:hypothetical protein